MRSRRLSAFIFRISARMKAKRGKPEGYLWLGMQAETDGNPRAVERANEYYRLAARGGNAEAMWYLAVNCLGNKGGRKDLDQARYWMRKAAEAGHLEAAWTLGGFHLRGLLVEKDPALALQWLEQAAEAGHGPARRQVYELYSLGAPGIDADASKAAHYRPQS